MRKLVILLAVVTLAAPMMFIGCGSDGSAGPAGPPGPPGPGVQAAFNLESCAICHNDQTIRNGDAHQADYDQRFQDQVVVVDNMAYSFVAADNTHHVTFNMTKNGLPFNCTQITTGAPDDSLSLGFAEYDAATRSFDPPAPLADRLALGSQTTLTYDAGTNTCTSIVADNSVLGPVGDLALLNGIVEMNGRDDRQGTLPSPSRVQLSLFPFAQVTKLGTVDYVSAANVDGCQKCHTVPYLKHGFIYGRIGGVSAGADNTTDFYTCKGCHMDNGPGGHSFWQELVDDPALAARDFNGALTTADETTIAAKYSYTSRLMNDVHMSHAMEFEYPQSMSSCVTCHEGKLDLVLTDNNFTLETCRSCHPVTGSAQAEKAQPALADILPAAIHGSFDLYDNATNCNGCHKVGGIGPVFSAIHNGYDKKIYAADATRYSSSITGSIDNASYVDNTHMLSFQFSATGAVGTVDSADIVPDILVGLYAFDTKDYLFGPHETSNGQRLLEFSAATPAPSNNSPRITVTGGAGTWNVTADLTDWASYIDNGSVKRVELAVLPTLMNADNVVIALNAPSQTFNLVTKAAEPAFFGNSIVKASGGAIAGSAKMSGCNNCHDALATTFHTPDRGGNVVVCRLCHITKAPGSHLELQSRSIDSYVHAIHRFQDFNTGSIDFTDPVALMFYQLHVESNFPTFGIEDCRACHNASKFNVPDQAKSLPGELSNTDFGTVRNIGVIDNDVITGPATRACGACHRAEAIIANGGFGDAALLSNLNSHMSTFGYILPTPPANILDVIFQVYAALGAEGAVLPAP